MRYAETVESATHIFKNVYAAMDNADVLLRVQTCKVDAFGTVSKLMVSLTNVIVKDGPREQGFAWSEHL